MNSILKRVPAGPIPRSKLKEGYFPYYIIVDALCGNWEEASALLMQKVNSHHTERYRCTGGLTVTRLTNGWYRLTQAMQYRPFDDYIPEEQR